MMSNLMGCHKSSFSFAFPFLPFFSTWSSCGSLSLPLLYVHSLGHVCRQSVSQVLDFCSHRQFMVTTCVISSINRNLGHRHSYWGIVWSSGEPNPIPLTGWDGAVVEFRNVKLFVWVVSGIISLRRMDTHISSLLCYFTAS